MLFAFIALIIIQLTNASLPPICVDGYTLVNGKCLRLFHEETYHTRAEQTCRIFEGTLFDVKNAIDNRAIASFIGSQVETVWMGLFCFNNNLCLWDDNSGSTAAYDNFSPGNPKVTTGSCVYFETSSGRWLSAPCTEPRSYVCETPSTHEDPCYYNYNNYCYTFSHNQSSFTTAQAICEEECGNLVSIHSANENRYLMNIASHRASDNVLIGGMWPMDHMNTWVDGTMWDYSNIDSVYNPKNRCIAMANNGTSEYNLGQWFGVDCEGLSSFFCKRPAGVPCSTDQPKVTVTPVPSNESFCNSTVLMTPGIITSPNYPQNYDNNVYCSYKLSTLGSYNILLEFTSFSTEENVAPRH